MSGGVSGITRDYTFRVRVTRTWDSAVFDCSSAGGSSKVGLGLAV